MAASFIVQSRPLSDLKDSDAQTMLFLSQHLLLTSTSLYPLSLLGHYHYQAG